MASWNKPQHCGCKSGGTFNSHLSKPLIVPRFCHDCSTNNSCLQAHSTSELFIKQLENNCRAILEPSRLPQSGPRGCRRRQIPRIVAYLLDEALQTGQAPGNSRPLAHRELNLHSKTPLKLLFNHHCSK